MRKPNGFGGIVKNGGARRKPYQLRKTVGYTDTGKQMYETIGWYRTREEAEIALAEYNKNPYNIESTVTFKELYEQWSKKHFPEISEGTVNNYKNSMKHCQSLYNIKVNKIRIMELQETIDNCPKYSIRKHLRVFFNMIYKFAVKSQIVGPEYNTLKLEIGKEQRVHEKKPFTNEEVKKLWDNVGKIPYIETVLMLCYSGMRIQELLNIETTNTYIEERYVIGGEKTTAGKNRVIPIHKDTKKFFEKYYNPENTYLLTIDGKKISYPTYIRKIWNPIMEELEMNHTPHECRHYAITSLDKAEVPRRITKRIVGHIDYNGGDITDRYSHTSIQELIENIDKI